MTQNAKDKLQQVLGIIETGASVVPEVGGAISVAIGLAKAITAGDVEPTDEQVAAAKAQTDKQVAEFLARLQSNQ